MKSKGCYPVGKIQNLKQTSSERVRHVPDIPILPKVISWFVSISLLSCTKDFSNYFTKSCTKRTKVYFRVYQMLCTKAEISCTKVSQNAQNAQKSGILICSFWCGFGGAESHIISIYKGSAFSLRFKSHRLHELVSPASVLSLLIFR